ncbi:MAG: DUF4402 domain-containing protein [Sphingomicrobium sp.]
MSRLTQKVIGAAAIALIFAFAAAPAQAATTSAAVNANVIKPLILGWRQDFDLGTVVLVGTGTWSGATVGISRSGVFTCTDPRLSCSGATFTGRYNVSGTNNTQVTISASNVLLTNTSDPTQTLTLVVDNPGSVVLTNSGPPGTDFNLGGSITLGSSNAGGTYTGQFNVTVNY